MIEFLFRVVSWVIVFFIGAIIGAGIELLYEQYKEEKRRKV